ncbi:MAG: TIGR03960 family B12-binding radical SAM protein [Defluviitaleaceae bacterium]|nr:TIGR03960 family B12-binding radical SAM protein [Defluviitaleaceae bacterium]MCL2275968.1 TIGR03960 family B12-binding radical SAM protein [Defluviitaleaceae bacterium]
MHLSNEALLRVEKPARYVGGEVNAVIKDKNRIRFGFCFPDAYEVGMSHLGLQMLYFFMNRREDTWCERVFMPFLDMQQVMREENIPLYALESGDPIKDLDILGFTLQYEMCYTNVLAMLELGGLALRAADRGEDDPLVCAGGPCATNPEPMADFFDFFYIGDGEATLDEILDMYAKCKARGLSKEDFLEEITWIDGIYVPRFYDVGYKKDGTIDWFYPIIGDIPNGVKRAFVPELTYFPDKFLVPLVEAVHNRVTLELARGCMRGCRFCQAGYIYRPLRERGVDALTAHAENLLSATGHEEVSLLALSACDHSGFGTLVDKLLTITEPARVSLSLPSTRLDAAFFDAIKKTQRVRKSSLTVAPEAGSQRMRDAINKNLTEADILDGCLQAFESGFHKIKLYFMAGLPWEEMDDIRANVQLAEKVVDAYYKLTYEQRTKPVSVSVSTACFVPKAFTPFQWAAQVNPMDFEADQREVKSNIRKKQIVYRYHDAKTAHIEGVLARGDRRLSHAIEHAYRAGAMFDGWSEHFRYDRWLRAFESAGIDPAFYANRERAEDEVLPWDFIDIGVTKAFLLEEYKRAKNSVLTPNCREKCANCGVMAIADGGKCHG